MRVWTVRDLGCATRIRALAFGGKRWRIAAIWPVMFTVSALPLAIGEVHLTNDRNGTFSLSRRGAVAGVRYLVAAAILLALLIAVGVAAVLIGPIATTILGIAFWIYSTSVLLGTVILIASHGRGTSLSEVGPETPKGRRWSLGSLAQRPTTHWSAL